MRSRLHIALALPVLLVISSQGAAAQSFFDDIESYNSRTNLDEYNDNGPFEQGGRVKMNSSLGRADCDCGGVNAFTATLVTDRWVEVRLELDLDQDTATAFYDGTAMGLVAVMPGDTWNFQAWHRDFVGGSVTSNFSDGLSVDFR